MRVFVLSTGRCGSMTFTHACRHMSNFTAGHERNAGWSPSEHLDYPDDHVESDNRLSWFLGPLGERYPDARYVHLRRDPDAVVASLLKRWPNDPTPLPWRRHPLRRIKRTVAPIWAPGTRAGNGMMGAFAYPLMSRPSPWPEAERRSVVNYYVDTVTANIRYFLRDKEHLTVDLENIATDFLAVWDWIGAEGDRDAAVAELGIRHNRS